MPIRAAWQKLQMFKIQDGGRPPFWKSLNRHISVKNCPILLKLGILHQILNLMSHVTKNWNFYNSRWWRPPSWKSLFWPLLINRLSDFSEILYEQAERHVGKGYGTKKANFKIQDGGQPPLWKSSNRHNISVKTYPISTKFGTLQQMLNTIAVTWPKIKRFKI